MSRSPRTRDIGDMRLVLLVFIVGCACGGPPRRKPPPEPWPAASAPGAKAIVFRLAIGVEIDPGLAARERLYLDHVSLVQTCAKGGGLSLELPTRRWSGVDGGQVMDEVYLLEVDEPSCFFLHVWVELRWGGQTYGYRCGGDDGNLIPLIRTAEGTVNPVGEIVAYMQVLPSDRPDEILYSGTCEVDASTEALRRVLDDASLHPKAAPWASKIQAAQTVLQ